ncbi:Uncharacterised protein [Clostridium putrefaciens]|uniref:Uncharacterized protein n=1 Tax=Clostridium putrefaciens TaxID=99675 RepID=A0A381J666_9CLOT|nr:hypothetical protein [Clostridium putrefaciens]SUY46784.1 Uncharacterised protein [Clostridium putrefaciens]
MDCENLDTIDMLKILRDKPTLKAINDKGCIVGVTGDEKSISIRNTGYEKLSLEDNWIMIEPIEYDKANELFRKGRMVELIYPSGRRKQYRKMPLDGNVILETDLPIPSDGLWYCYWS